MLLFLKVASSDLIHGTEPLDSPVQPWAVSIAAELATMDGKTIGKMLAPIRSGGRSIKPAATARHGVSTKDAARAGVSEIAALGFLVQLAMNPTHLIAWRAAFDRDVLVAALSRLGKDSRMLVRNGLQLVSVQDWARFTCRLPGGEDGQFKLPTLDEASQIILGDDRPPPPHSAADDMRVMRDVFYALRHRNVIRLEGVSAA